MNVYRAVVYNYRKKSFLLEGELVVARCPEDAKLKVAVNLSITEDDIDDIDFIFEYVGNVRDSDE